MALGFLLHDLLYLTCVGLIWGSAFSIGRWGFHQLAPLGWIPAALLSCVLALLGAIGVTALLTALCPRLKPGRYKMMQGRVFYSWMLRALIRRSLFFPGVKWVLFSSNLLRFLALRGLGADVAFTSSFSADVDLLDPALLTVEAGAVIGARCLLTGHFVQSGELLLDRVHVARGALLAGEVIALPGVRIGERALIKGRAALSLQVEIGERASIGACCGIDAHAKVGKGARIGNTAVVGPRALVPDGAEVPWGARFGDPKADVAD